MNIYSLAKLIDKFVRFIIKPTIQSSFTSLDCSHFFYSTILFYEKIIHRLAAFTTRVLCISTILKTCGAYGPAGTAIRY